MSVGLFPVRDVRDRPFWIIISWPPEFETCRRSAKGIDNDVSRWSTMAHVVDRCLAGLLLLSAADRKAERSRPNYDANCLWKRDANELATKPQPWSQKVFGLIALALMVVLTFLYLNDLGLLKVLGFWGAYIATWFLPLIGIPSIVAALCGLGVAGAYFVTAKSA